MEQFKKCIKCGRELPLTEFVKRKTSPSGVRGECKECTHAYGKQWRASRSKTPSPEQQHGYAQCSKCKQTLPNASFYFRVDIGKYQTICKTCFNGRQKQWRERYKAAPKTESSAKVCSKCGIEKPAEEFYPNKVSGDGLRAQCRDCRNEQERIARRENPEIERVRTLRYRTRHIDRLRQRNRDNYQKEKKNNPEQLKARCVLNAERRRAAESEASRKLTKEEVVEILKGPCAFCGTYKRLELAHKKAVVKHGLTEPDNVFCLCRSCNAKMWIRTPEEYLALNKSVSK